MKRILVVNLNWRGDVLFSTPFIKALRKAYSQSFISCLVVERCQQILQNNPNLNEIIIYDEDKTHKGLFGKLKLICDLKKRQFDTVFLLHRSFTRRMLCFFAKIPKRIGYVTKRRGFLLTDKIKSPGDTLHRIDYYLNLAKAVGIEAEDRRYEFFIMDKDKEFANNWLAKNNISRDDFLAVINPGGNWLPKRWPEENFAYLADRLIENYNVKIVITGAAKDINLAKKITSLMKNSAVISCGITTLGQLGGILKRANFVISNDSGPAHIASALSNTEPNSSDKQRSKIIVIFGPTSPKVTGPAGERNYVLNKDIGCVTPCYNLRCIDNKCMKAITVEDVLNLIKDAK